MQQTNLYFKN